MLQGLAAAGELGQDRFDGGVPDEGFGIFIPGFQELSDRRYQIRHAGEGVATDTLGGQFSKPTLDEVAPTATGGHEVNHETRVALEPGFDGGMAVGAVVVNHQVQAKRGGGTRRPSGAGSAEIPGVGDVGSIGR